MRIASICIHKGEEPAISGENGICNVFFAGCNMKCSYCQNFQVSRKEYFLGFEEGTSGRLRQDNGSGRLRQEVAGVPQSWGNYREYTPEEAALEITGFLKKGINSVGFVTPSHYLPHVKETIKVLHDKKYSPTIVYNTNGYEKAEALSELEGLIDVYLPDFKYLDRKMAKDYSDTEDYPDIITGSIKEMYRQKGSTLILDDNGQAISGLIIRHLVLPGGSSDSKDILRWIASNLSMSVHISLMSQYFPTQLVCSHPVLGRTPDEKEYYDVVRTLEDLGFYNGWVQDLSSSMNYKPDFMKEDPFS